MNFETIQSREGGLHRKLTGAQMSMIAVGGAIGTGLFLGSKFAIGFAGPSVLLSYAIGGLIALLLMGCLAEMTVAHSTSGSFGAYAEHYIGPLAGFLTRYAYWACVVLAMGTEVTAIADYMKFWFPTVPPVTWMALFSAVLIAVNAISVKAFGSIEYVFSSIKVFAVIGFILAGAYLLGFGGNPDWGSANFTRDGGFFPNGLSGTWTAVIISIFSYLSIEMIAVAAGEAENPAQAVRSAFKATVIRLLLFYLGSLAIILAIVPWRHLGEGGSPFVTVMDVLGIPYAAGILNAVVVVAALSAMNSQLYVSTRMMFSLSRAGDAPAILGYLNKRGIPVWSMVLSSCGIGLATLIYMLWPSQAFTLMISISIFGALFTWSMIFLTHLFFRRRCDPATLSFRMWGQPWTTMLGLGLMVAVMVTTWFTESFHLTLVTGVPFMLCLVASYRLRRIKRDWRSG